MKINTYGELKKRVPSTGNGNTLAGSVVGNGNDQKSGKLESQKSLKSLKSALYYTPLVSDDTTYQELIEILMNRAELEEATKIEREERERREREARLQELLHEEYDGEDELVEASETDDSSGAEDKAKISNKQTKSRKRPGAIQLRSSVLCIGKREFDDEGICEVFANGYAIYDNGNRKTVVWLPEDRQYTYYFNPLRESEKLYQRDHEGISEEEWNGMPWHVVLLMRGEDQIERNLVHPKNQGSMSDFEALEEWDQKKSYKWTCGAYFENPEEAFFEKVDEEERITALSSRQRTIYHLYYKVGMKQEEIAVFLGISQPAVFKNLKRIEKILKN